VNGADSSIPGSHVWDIIGPRYIPGKDKAPQTLLTPIEPQHTTTGGKEREKTVRGSPQAKWSPTKQAFEKLLASFSSDRDEAARQYEIVRLKLLRFFERRGVVGAEHHVDEAFDRVMRRLDEGENITHLMAYFYKVASYILMEIRKEPEQFHLADNLPSPPAPPASGEESPQLKCFDRCLNGLPVESRILIRDYYQEEGRTKIQLRRQTAQRLGIPLNALRIRAHRIRVALEACVKHCLAETS
jgi:DNA-directed RNA polymerase specialized sigma24 family protein